MLQLRLLTVKNRSLARMKTKNVVTGADDLISSFLSWDMPSDSEMSGVSLTSVTEMEVVLS